MRVVITAGGTGGHIFPALAIYDQLKKTDPKLEVLYIGTTDRMESTMIPEKKIPYVGIPMKGINRKNIFANIKVIATFFSAIKIAKKQLKKFHPDIVIGVGGYISAPVLYAAHQLKIKTAIHEQNSIAGVSNRFLSKFVDKIFISFEESRKDFPQEKTVFTGNPRSEAVLEEKVADKRDYHLSPSKQLVLIVMGSLGSMTMTEKLKEMIPYFEGKSYEVLLITGKEYYNSFAQEKIPKNVKLVPFLSDFLKILKCANLIVTRAGASSIAEITAIGLPAIFVPSPYVTGNHQMKNAKALEKEGAGIVLKEEEFSYQTLLPFIDQILTDQKVYQKMKKASHKMSVSNSASLIVKEIKTLVEENVK